MPMAFLLSDEWNSMLVIWIKKCHHHKQGPRHCLIVRRGSGPVCIGRPDTSIRQYLSHDPLFLCEPLGYEAARTMERLDVKIVTTRIVADATLKANATTALPLIKTHLQVSQDEMKGLG